MCFGLVVNLNPLLLLLFLLRNQNIIAVKYSPNSFIFLVDDINQQSQQWSVVLVIPGWTVFVQIVAFLNTRVVLFQFRSYIAKVQLFRNSLL